MFRFTIRDVLWLMVVVGMGAAWLFDRRQLAAHHKRVEDQQAEALIDSWDVIESGKQAWQKKMGELLGRPVP